MKNRADTKYSAGVRKYSLFSEETLFFQGNWEKSNFIKSDILLPDKRDKMSNFFPVTEKIFYLFCLTFVVINFLFNIIVFIISDVICYCV